MREKLAREKAAGEEDKGKTHAMDSPNDASSEDSNDSNRFQKGNQWFIGIDVEIVLRFFSLRRKLVTDFNKNLCIDRGDRKKLYVVLCAEINSVLLCNIAGSNSNSSNSNWGNGQLKAPGDGAAEPAYNALGKYHHLYICNTFS